MKKLFAMAFAFALLTTVMTGCEKKAEPTGATGETPGSAAVTRPETPETPKEGNTEPKADNEGSDK